MASSDSHPVETIRLTERDKKRLIEKVNERSVPIKPSKEHRRLRVDYSATGNIIVTIWNASGRPVNYSVIPRNLSTGGIAFVHGQFVHPNSNCKVTLPSRAGQVDIVGKILACRHIAGLVHEVSVKFDHPIELGDYVEFSPEQALQNYRESKKAEHGDELGQALVVDALDSDRKLIAHWLNKYGLTPKEATDLSEGLMAVQSGAGFEVVLIDFQKGHAEHLDLVRSIRQDSKTNSYVVGISADDDPETQNMAVEAGCDTFLSKPFEPTVLRDLLVNALLGGGSASSRGPMRSKFADDQDMAPLIRAFVESLDDYSIQLDQAARTNNYQFAAEMCRQLKGASGGYGFESISLSAQMALSLLQDEKPNEQAVRRAIAELTALLKSARA